LAFSGSYDSTCLDIGNLMTLLPFEFSYPEVVAVVAPGTYN